MYLGIDLGTSSVKLLLMDKNGKIESIIQKEYPINYFNGNWAEQNPEDWWYAVKDGITEISQGVKIKGISFSGQMHGLVVLDKSDNIIRPAILWCDQRTEKECIELNNKKITKFTGNQALTGFTAPKILWMKENEIENFNKISKIMLPKDYIAYKLTGIHATDVSDASGMLIFDVKERRWSKEAMEILGIKINQLAKVYESFEVIGSVKKELLEELNLSHEVKVIIGGGDQAVGAIGVGAVEEGLISVALGTSGVVFAPTEKFYVDKKFRLHSFCHANNKYHQMGVMLSASSSYKWWIENINESKEYEKFNKLAEKANAGSNGLYFLPYLIGERTPHNDPEAKGGFIGLNINHTKGDMTRSILEGVSYGLKDSLILLEGMGIKINKVRISGGGSKSKLWKQILADIFNKEIISVNSEEGPAFGAAILACVGCGVYKTVEEACSKIINETEVILPNDKNIVVYKEGYKKFISLYPALKGKV